MLSDTSKIIVGKIEYPNLHGYIEVPNLICKSCKNNRDYFPESIPLDCYTCKHLTRRNDPYYIKLPVWEEGYIPNKSDIEYFQNINCQKGEE